MAYAGRICDRLEAHFGKSNVFMNIDTLAPGVDFVEVLDRTISSCAVLLAIIGKRWLKATDKEGRLLLSNPEDFVRVESGFALKRNIRVVPLLVDGAKMPSPANVPEALVSLTTRHALRVSDVGFRPTIDRLIESIWDETRVERDRLAREAATKAADTENARTNTYDFSISYASEDMKIAMEIRTLLVGTGAACWMAPDSIELGEPYTRAIPRAIRGSHCFLLLFSKWSDVSEDVNNEIILARKHKKQVVPIRIEDYLPDFLGYHLGAMQWIDFFGDAKHQSETKLKKLASTVADSAERDSQRLLACRLAGVLNLKRLIATNTVQKI